jgi:hypothetical protein
MRRLAFIIAVTAATVLGADLDIVDSEIRCDFEKPCILRVQARGGHLREVHVEPVDKAQAIESNKVFAPDGVLTALTLTLKDKSAVGQQDIPLDIHFLADGKPGPPKRARLIVGSAAPTLSVFEGKPVAIRAVREVFTPAVGQARVQVRASKALAACPQVSGTDLYRTEDEERYALADGTHEATIDTSKPGCSMNVAVELPAGNYTAAGGTVYLKAPGSDQEVGIPILIRIKDRSVFPLCVLILGHLVMWALRLWVGQIRPLHLNNTRMLELTEDLRQFELNAAPLSDADLAQVLKLKAVLARARRLNDTGDTAAVAPLLDQVTTTLDTLTNGAVSARMVQSRVQNVQNIPSGGNVVGRQFRRLGALIVRWDLPVEFVAMAISILLGAQIFASAARFGTYEDYLKVFLFGFGISTSTQGFLAVAGQLKPSNRAS